MRRLTLPTTPSLLLHGASALLALAALGCDPPTPRGSMSEPPDAHVSGDDASRSDAGVVAREDAGAGPDATAEVDAGARAEDAGSRPDAFVPSPDAAISPMDAGSTSALSLPPANAQFDYQLAGGYTPPRGVRIVSRDRTASPAAGFYNICYVNGFQIQPDEESFWMREHPDLILRDSRGNPVVDADWDEMMIDVGTAAKRTAVAAVVGEWIAGCARDGFDAVEIDNLDSFSRSGGRLEEADAVAMMRMFSDAAHAVGLAIAQKNSAEIVHRRAELGTDFVVAEECNRYSECDVYTEGYGDLVFIIEYRRADFDRGCRDFPGLSIILRDLNLVTPSTSGYVYDDC